MGHIKSNAVAFLTLIALFVDMKAFARDYAMPYIPIPSGPPAAQSERSNAEAQAERIEAIRLRMRKGDTAAGENKSLLCAGCHGELGISMDPLIPNLAGKYKNYIIKQVRNFQLDTRSNGIMSAMASTINEDGLLDAATYYSSMERMKGSSLSENRIGRELFSDNGISDMGLACVNCHGEGGNGLEPKISAFPVIGGQQKDYIRQQLIDFRNGKRTNSPNNIMNRMTSSLTDDQIESLSEYLSGH